MFNNRNLCLCLCCVGLPLLSSQRGCRAHVCMIISFKKDSLSFHVESVSRQQPTSPSWTKLIKGRKDIYHSNGDYRVLLEIKIKYWKFGEKNLFLAKANGFLANSWAKFATPGWLGSRGNKDMMNAMENAKGTFFHDCFYNNTCDKSWLKLHYLHISSLLTPFISTYYNNN